MPGSWLTRRENKRGTRGRKWWRKEGGFVEGCTRDGRCLQLIGEVEGSASFFEKLPQGPKLQPSIPLSHFVSFAKKKTEHFKLIILFIKLQSNHKNLLI